MCAWTCEVMPTNMKFGPSFQSRDDEMTCPGGDMMGRDIYFIYAVQYDDVLYGNFPEQVFWTPHMGWAI